MVRSIFFFTLFFSSNSFLLFSFQRHHKKICNVDAATDWQTVIEQRINYKQNIQVSKFFSSCINTFANANTSRNNKRMSNKCVDNDRLHNRMRCRAWEKGWLTVTSWQIVNLSNSILSHNPEWMPLHQWTSVIYTAKEMFLRSTLKKQSRNNRKHDCSIVSSHSFLPVSLQVTKQNKRIGKWCCHQKYRQNIFKKRKKKLKKTIDKNFQIILWLRKF